MLKLQPKSLFVGQNQVYLPHCHSTNDVASGLGQNTTFIDGTLVITDFQSQGRGQRGAVWEGEPGKNLMMSLLLDTSFLPVSRQFDLSKCAALAVVITLQNAGIRQARVKWPNDLFVAGRKVGGILIENTLRELKLRTSVVGIGINVKQQTFLSPIASSLENEGYEVGRNDLAERICENFEKFYARLKQGEDLHDDYLSVLFGLNEKRRYSSDSEEFTGTIVGVSEIGKLQIESNFHQKEFDIREISFCF